MKKQQFDIGTYFTIQYYAQKDDKTITRRGQWDGQCFEGIHKTKGHPYKIYVDVDATEEKNNGKNQYRCASYKWEINEKRTI